MLSDPNAAASDYWLQQIHVMAHRVALQPVVTQPFEPSLAGVSDNASQLGRSNLAKRRDDFRRHWLADRVPQ